MRDDQLEMLRIYVDTSVLGGCFDPEFSRWSLALVRDFRARHSEKPAAYAASATDVPRASSRAPHCRPARAHTGAGEHPPTS
jgi:hypothetical protein